MILELSHDVGFEPERVDDGLSFGEFDEVESAERGGILVLFPALDSQVLSLDFEGELGHVVFAQVNAQIFFQKSHHGYTHGG